MRVAPLVGSVVLVAIAAASTGGASANDDAWEHESARSVQLRLGEANRSVVEFHHASRKGAFQNRAVLRSGRETRAELISEYFEKDGTSRLRFEDRLAAFWIEQRIELIALGTMPATVEDHVAMVEEKRLFELHTVRTSTGLDLRWEETPERGAQHASADLRAAILRAAPDELGIVPESVAKEVSLFLTAIDQEGRQGILKTTSRFLEVVVSAAIERSAALRADDLL